MIIDFFQLNVLSKKPSSRLLGPLWNSSIQIMRIEFKWNLYFNSFFVFFFFIDKLIHVSNFLFSTFIHLNGHTIRLISLSILTLSLIQAPCTFCYECLLDKLIFRNFPLIFDLLKTTVFFSFFAVFFRSKSPFQMTN